MMDEMEACADNERISDTIISDKTDDLGRRSSAFSFTVDFDCNKQKSKIPSRFLKYEKGRTKSLTGDDLKLKQAQADQRRNDYEKAKIERIKERSEECIKIDSKVQKLLAQDAKRKGLPGTENIKPMSSREVTQSLRTLMKDFSKITTEMKSENITP